MSESGRRPRRELLWAAASSVLGSLVALEALGRSWVSYQAPGGLSIEPLTLHVRGNDVAHGAEVAAVLALAAVLAVLATRRRPRQVLGVVLVVAGALVCAGALRGLVRSGRDMALQALGSAAGVPAHADVARGWPALTLLAGLLVMTGGALTVVRGRSWAGLGASYEAPGGPPPEPATDKGVWDALDRGDDPTA